VIVTVSEVPAVPEEDSQLGDVIEDKAVISPSDAVSHTGFAVDWLRTSLAQTRRVSRFALHARRLAVRSLRLFQGGVIRHEKSGRHVTA